jgi:hypothetical protein
MKPHQAEAGEHFWIKDLGPYDFGIERRTPISSQGIAAEIPTREMAERIVTALHSFSAIPPLVEAARRIVDAAIPKRGDTGIPQVWIDSLESALLAAEKAMGRDA